MDRGKYMRRLGYRVLFWQFMISLAAMVVFNTTFTLAWCNASLLFFSFGAVAWYWENNR